MVRTNFEIIGMWTEKDIEMMLMALKITAAAFDDNDL